MKYMEREHAKHVLKTRFYSSYLTHYIGTNTRGSQEFILNFSFICGQFNMVQISNDCACVRCRQNQAGDEFFLSRRIKPAAGA